ncbi:MAG: ATP-binding protein [Chitinophagaceae bacterium]
MRRPGLIIAFIGLMIQGIPCLCQTKAVDSLRHIIDTTTSDDKKLSAILGLNNLALNTATQPQKEIALCLEGVAIARRMGLPLQLLMIYKSLAENYKAAGNQEEYGKVLESIIVLKDSLHNINSSKMLADLASSYEARRKEKTITQQQLTLTKKNYWLFAVALFTLMAGILSWLGFKYYKRRQQLTMLAAIEKEKVLSAQAMKDAEEQERKQIAADLHDNLGAYAASMASNISYLQVYNEEENKDALNELKKNSNAIISELNDTTWVLKKDALPLTAISDRIKVFINRIRKGYPDIHIETDEKIETDYLLPSAQAFHLYRVVQEAIINSLKHSQGKNIVVKVSGDNGWNVQVEDDGIGLQHSNESSVGGNGLLNMHDRVSEAGWEIEWHPSDEGGTTVNISPVSAIN